MRKLKAIKSDLLLWNKEAFGDVGMRYAKLENKIRQLHEQEKEGQGSDEVAIERRKAKCARVSVS